MLIKCPECDNDISDSAETCPRCGYVIYEDEHITEGILSIVIGIVSWVIAFSINKGILLIIPFIMFCISMILEKKCLKRFSIIGFAISSIGILMLLITFIF